ncbi:unnamed protein product, partial [Heterotrigona itama]
MACLLIIEMCENMNVMREEAQRWRGALFFSKREELCELENAES